jgi:hypothetical protein
MMRPCFGIDADAEGIRDRVGDPEERDGEIIGDPNDGVAIVFDDFDVIFDVGVFEFMPD